MEKRHAAKEQRQESDGYSVGSRLGGSVSLPERTLWGCLCIQIAGTDLSPSTPYSPCQYHSTIAPYSFIHLPPTLYNAFLPVHQFSPVSIIPPLPYTHLYLNTVLIRRTVNVQISVQHWPQQYRHRGNKQEILSLSLLIHRRGASPASLRCDCRLHVCTTAPLCLPLGSIIHRP